MAKQNWRMIDKVCITCGDTFKCKSTNRRTQWCNACADKRNAHKSDGHKTSAAMSRRDRKLGKSCGECGNPGYTYHHITRLADGGSKGSENMVFLCLRCHFKKHFNANPIIYISRLLGR